VATVANFTAVLVAFGVALPTSMELIITMGMITVVMFLGLFFIRSWGSGDVAVVFVWALSAIAVRHWSGENSLAIVALAAASLLALRLFSGWRRQWWRFSA
jgi:hypothetical protein